MSATRPCTSARSGDSAARMRPRRRASSHRPGPHPVVAGGGRVALVEDEVDDLEHRGRAGPPARRPRGTSNGTLASARARLARTIRWATVGSGTRKARAISSVVRPPSRRNVSATRASGDSTGWQEVNTRRSRSSPTSSSRASSSASTTVVLLGAQLLAELVVLALEQLVPAELVDGPVLGRGHQPGARVVGHPRLGPLLEGRRPGRPGPAPRPGPTSRTMRARPAISRGGLDPPDRVDRAMRLGGRHRPQ